ncbi:hypothetical protein BKA67DRAFT_537104 [Truncatella angustata]|uniref:Uncharacterized protein n=1 Tax=Truncatella angustata TaxID=152316 RepID=A0A9P8UK18_9PEZI|nr:uncharacterized protein BKA67DRAFT_537104 [Truncatella angustata]KAH6653420.1 hypothetical protein BKA67DRAFT_537104 [Truncatella angustata]
MTHFSTEMLALPIHETGVDDNSVCPRQLSEPPLDYSKYKEQLQKLVDMNKARIQDVSQNVQPHVSASDGSNTEHRLHPLRPSYATYEAAHHLQIPRNDDNVSTVGFLVNSNDRQAEVDFFENPRFENDDDEFITFTAHWKSSRVTSDDLVGLSVYRAQQLVEEEFGLEILNQWKKRLLVQRQIRGKAWHPWSIQELRTPLLDQKTDMATFEAVWTPTNVSLSEIIIHSEGYDDAKNAVVERFGTNAWKRQEAKLVARRRRTMRKRRFARGRGWSR